MGGRDEALPATCRECPLSKEGVTGRGEVVWCTARGSWVAPATASGCEVPMSSGRAWTDEELVALGSFYPEHGASWDGWEDVLPGRTQRAIAMCAFKHHIRHLDASEPEEPTIRPCPFCGAMPSVGHAEHRGRMWWRIWCDNARCGTNVESIADSLERAAANWDRRA